MRIRLTLLCLLLFAVGHSQQARITAFPPLPFAEDSVLFAFKILMEDGAFLDVLSKGSIELSDDGVPVDDYEISYTEPPGIDSNYIVLLLDVSGSMRYKGKLARLQRAAATIVRTLSSKDNCAIISFASTAQILSPFSNDTTMLLARIETLGATAGYTAMYDGLYQAIGVFSPLAPEAHKIILLITDGIEEGSTYLSGTDIAPKLQAVNNLTVHTFDISEREKPDLRRIAMLGNGSYTFRPNPEEVFQSFERFFAQYKKAYVVRYAIPSRDTAKHRTVSCLLHTGNLPQRIVLEYRVPPRPDRTLLYLGAVLTIILGAALIVWFGFRHRNQMFHTRTKPDSPGFDVAPPHLFHEPSGAHPPEMIVPDVDEAIPAPIQDERTMIVRPDTVASNQTLGYLALRTPSGLERLIELEKDELLLGRGSQCEIRLENTEVSRVHAKLRLTGEGFMIHDAGSGNGIMVNGKEITRLLLRDGDTIDIGGNILIFKEIHS